MKLNQTKQCKTCPWKADTTVTDIPNYSLDRPLNLASTIADLSGNLPTINEPLKVMACHNSSEGKEYECIGWLNNQLGAGNIPLLLKMRHFSNKSGI